jgi:RNA-directed DNA polymerase
VSTSSIRWNPRGAEAPLLHRIKARLAEWLTPRGLVFNEDKTQITHLEDRGVDFLGFSIRRYPNGKLLTKPSNDAL